MLLRARLLQALDRGPEALPLLRGAIRDNPDDKRLRLTYARTLVEQDRIDDAKAEFESLVQQYPEDDECYSLALVCLEAKHWDEAEGYQEMIEREANVDAAHLNLGRMREERGPAGALREYALVGPAMTTCRRNCARPTS
jgi:uncharacterized protein (TIGR02996 family)